MFLKKWNDKLPDEYNIKTKSFWAIILCWLLILTSMLITGYLYINREELKVFGSNPDWTWESSPHIAVPISGDTQMIMFGLASMLLVALGLILTLGVVMIKEAQRR